MGNAMRIHCSKRNKLQKRQDLDKDNRKQISRKRNQYSPSEDNTTTTSSIGEEVTSDFYVDSSSSWETTLETRSDFSISLPTGESEWNKSEISIEESDEEIGDELHTSDEDDQRRSTAISSESVHSSDTSVDFSSFKPLSQLSEHSLVRLREEDIQWADAVRRYHSKEPIFHRPFIKSALKIRARRIKPKLSWHRCYHQWAVRQPPQPYRGKDVLNPFAATHHRAGELINVAEEVDDCDRGIFVIQTTAC